MLSPRVVKAIGNDFRNFLVFWITNFLALQPEVLYSRLVDVLIAWLGQTDLDASVNESKVGRGPIAGAVEDRDFDRVLLLNTYPSDQAARYAAWLGARTEAMPALEVRQVQLPSPVDYAAIYREAVAAVESVRAEHGPATELTFHLSPGTPAMAAVWLLLAKARYDAKLIDSSREHGLRDVDLPFEISMEFIPELLRPSDRRLVGLAAATPPELPDAAGIVGRSPAMQVLLERARAVAPRSVPVLIEGESGTGKELCARFIHAQSPRRSHQMVSVNCGAIPETLVESTLFGHVKGAFTNADRAKRGLFQTANGSTLLLDEVGELPPEAQVKLLRALQEGEVTPVGGNAPEKVDVRIIAATNRTLVDEVAAGRFRSDLYYRLAVAVLTLPPLREREGDLGLLIDHFLARINAEQREHDPNWKDRRLAPGARSLLLRHPFPGNVRELENTLTRAVIWCTGEVIREVEMREAFQHGVPANGETILNRALGPGLDIRELQADIARHYLERAMKEAGGNKSKAAELVGLPSYQTLSNWLEKYGVGE